MNDPGYEYLISAQNSDGGWGYFINQPSTVEATASSILSLSSFAEYDDTRERGLNWLRDTQNSDGGWGIKQHDSQSGWQTSWALLALNSSSGDPQAIQAGVNWLRKFGFSSLEDNETNKLIQKQFNIDTNLSGWTWQPGQASWIEPTAMALLALHQTAQISEEDQMILEAVQYLDDRRCQGGGWNFGNPVMFNKPLPSRIHHTALCIITLSQVAPELVLEDDKQTLNELLRDEQRPLGFAMGILALKSMEQDTTSYQDKLVSLQESDGSWEGNTHFSALALTAINSQPYL
jgi:squalene cyclase